jgi:hypothetical protein
MHNKEARLKHTKFTQKFTHAISKNCFNLLATSSSAPRMMRKNENSKFLLQVKFFSSSSDELRREQKHKFHKILMSMKRQKNEKENLHQLFKVERRAKNLIYGQNLRFSRIDDGNFSRCFLEGANVEFMCGMKENFAMKLNLANGCGV